MKAANKSRIEVEPDRSAFLATTPEDVAARGWEQVDVLFVSGDAYVDHPSFAMSILGRWLEALQTDIFKRMQPAINSCRKESKVRSHIKVRRTQ